jgi:hypothetical protein
MMQQNQAKVINRAVPLRIAWPVGSMALIH